MPTEVLCRAGQQTPSIRPAAAPARVFLILHKGEHPAERRKQLAGAALRLDRRGHRPRLEQRGVGRGGGGGGEGLSGGGLLRGHHARAAPNQSGEASELCRLGGGRQAVKIH